MMGSGMMGMMGPGMMGMMGGSGSAPTPGAAPIAGAPEVRVQAANFGFTPGEIRLPKDTPVTLTLVNPASAGTAHDLTVPALGITSWRSPVRRRRSGCVRSPPAITPRTAASPGTPTPGCGPPSTSNSSGDRRTLWPRREAPYSHVYSQRVDMSRDEAGRSGTTTAENGRED